MSAELLVLTEDGYAKRTAVDDVPMRHRGAKGVRLSSSPTAAVLEVHEHDDVVIATAAGKVARIAAADVPRRARRVMAGGRLAKGARVITLPPGDRVTSAAVAPDGVAQCSPADPGRDRWPWGTAGLQPGERIGSCMVFGAPTPLEEIRPGGKPAVPRDQWARTAIHRASTYSCAHCGQEHKDPEAVYECIDRHVLEAGR